MRFGKKSGKERQDEISREKGEEGSLKCCIFIQRTCIKTSKSDDDGIMQISTLFCNEMVILM